MLSSSVGIVPSLRYLKIEKKLNFDSIFKLINHCIFSYNCTKYVKLSSCVGIVPESWLEWRSLKIEKNWILIQYV